MLSINTGYFVAGSLVVGLVVGWYLTSDHLNAKHQIELQNLKIAADKNDKDLNAKISKLNQDLTKISATEEQKYVQKQKELETANAKYDSLVASGFRLRDPASSVSSHKTGSSVATSASSNHGTGAGELSEDASKRLWSLATRADRVTEKLIGCQSYVNTITDYMNTRVSSWNAEWASKN